MSLLVLSWQYVDWESSYSLLCTLYDEAVGKIESEVSEVTAEQLGTDKYQAIIDLLDYPYHIVGQCASSVRSAKSKVLFAALKYANQTLGYPIMDLNYTVLQHEEDMIAGYEQKMRAIWRCGQELERLLLSFDDLVAKNCHHVYGKVRPNESTMILFMTLDSVVSKVAKIKSSFYKD